MNDDLFISGTEANELRHKVSLREGVIRFWKAIFTTWMSSATVYSSFCWKFAGENAATDAAYWKTANIAIFVMLLSKCRPKFV